MTVAVSQGIRHPRSSTLSLWMIGCLICMISVLHLILTCQRLSSASLLMSDDNERASVTLTLTWKNGSRKKQQNDQISPPKRIESEDSPNIRTSSSIKDNKDDQKSPPGRIESKYSPNLQTTSSIKENRNVNVASNMTSFVRHDYVVIATKIHGEHQWPLLYQSMCLLHYAYNHKVLYDIVVFSTEPVPQDLIDGMQKMLAPVKFSVVVDNKGLQEEISDLSPTKYKSFLKRCNITSHKELSWFSKCGGETLAYNWQAEFRATRIWHHPALDDYDTMLWLDADAFSSKPWENDPVDYFIENEGVIMFSHFPQSSTKNWIQRYVQAGFKKTICKLTLSEETGNLVTQLGDKGKCMERGIPNIHGFFHITNLEFYRSPAVKEGLEIVFHDCFLCRSPDDQLAVTLPAAILAPHRSWDMRSRGFHFDIFHNQRLDGIERSPYGGFKTYWKNIGKESFSSANGICPVTEAQ